MKLPLSLFLLGNTSVVTAANLLRGAVDEEYTNYLHSVSAELPNNNRRLQKSSSTWADNSDDMRRLPQIRRLKSLERAINHKAEDASDNKGHNSLRALPSSVESQGTLDEEYLEYLEDTKSTSSDEDHTLSLASSEDESDPIVEAIEAIEAHTTDSVEKEDSGKSMAVDSASEDDGDDTSASSDDDGKSLARFQWVDQEYLSFLDSVISKNKKDAKDHRTTPKASSAVQHRIGVDQEYSSYLDSLSSAKRDDAKDQKKRALQRAASPAIHGRIRVDDEYASYHDAVNGLAAP
jgi:hypothetical protein